LKEKSCPKNYKKKLLEDWNKAERLIAIKWAIEEGSIDLKEASEIIIPAHDAHVKAGKKSATTKSILQGIAEAKGMPNKKRKYETIEPRDKQETEKRSITTQLSETSPIGKNPLPQRFKGSKSGLLLLPAGLRVISTKIRFALTIRLRNIHEEVYEKVSIGAPLYASYDKNEDKEKIIEKRFISGQLTQLIHDEIMKLNTNDEKTKKENEEKFLEASFTAFKHFFKKDQELLERFSGIFYTKKENNVNFLKHAFATMRGLDRIDEMSTTHIIISFCPEDESEKEMEYVMKKFAHIDEV